jgi:SAM-dependent methyltransferase
VTFFSVNRSLSRRFSNHLRRDGVSLGSSYAARVTDIAQRGDLITDVGAGRRTPFATQLPDGCRILGVDLLSEDLDANPALTERSTRNVATDGLPAEAHGSQIICSHFVLEHMPSLDAFAGEIFRALRPGGVTVHLFAGRWSPFAIANRLLPDVISRRVLFSLRPASREVGGFITYYDCTDPRSARKGFLDAGFTEVRTELSWEVSQYFDWFFPFYCVARTWERLAGRLRLEATASYVLLTASRPERTVQAATEPSP